MNIGILYHATMTTKQGVLTEHSLLSSVSKIANELEQMGHTYHLFESVAGVKELAEHRQEIDVVINYVPWTRTNKKIMFPSLLNFLELPFLGNGDEALMLCANKLLTKLIAFENEIPAPRYTIARIGRSTFEEIAGNLGTPFVLKANKTSGSLGVRLIHDDDEYKTALEELSVWGAQMFAEEYIPGTDITVPVITENGVPKALGSTIYLDEKHEKIPFFTHDYKYHEKLTCFNYSDFPTASLALEYAERLHMIHGCRAFSRVDFRLDTEGKLYLLEINGTPELNPSGAFTVAGCGRKFSDVLALGLEEALRF